MGDAATREVYFFVDNYSVQIFSVPDPCTYLIDIYAFNMWFMMLSLYMALQVTNPYADGLHMQFSQFYLQLCLSFEPGGRDNMTRHQYTQHVICDCQNAQFHYARVQPVVYQLLHILIRHFYGIFIHQHIYGRTLSLYTAWQVSIPCADCPHL